MLGYMNAQTAKAEGFTHHGSYYGIPVWMSDDDNNPMVATKWAGFEPVMTCFHYVEAVCNALLDREPTFMFKLGQPIAQQGL